jgi:hypothetical protein
MDLHEAARQGNLARVLELLEGGAAVDQLDPWENTPLLVACFSETHHPDVVAALRERGADPYRRNIHWDTPRSQAYERFLLSGFDPLADLPPPQTRETETGELSDEELAALALAVRAVVERDGEALRSMKADARMYAQTHGYGRWGTVELVVPPGDPRSWTVHVFRHDDRVGVEVEMWTRQEGRSDLTLQLDLRSRDDGAVKAEFRDLHVM